MKTQSVKAVVEQPERVARGSLRRMVRALIPRCSHARYAEPEIPRIEYEPAADYFRATLWIYWTWKNKGHRLLISLPDFVP